MYLAYIQAQQVPLHQDHAPMLQKRLLYNHLFLQVGPESDFSPKHSDSHSTESSISGRGGSGLPIADDSGHFSGPAHGDAGEWHPFQSVHKKYLVRIANLKWTWARISNWKAISRVTLRNQEVSGANLVQALDLQLPLHLRAAPAGPPVGWARALCQHHCPPLPHSQTLVTTTPLPPPLPSSPGMSPGTNHHPSWNCLSSARRYD